MTWETAMLMCGIFRRGEIILGVLRLLGTLKKTNWEAAATTQLAQKLLKKTSKTSAYQTPALSQSFPPGPSKVLPERTGGK